MKNKTVAALLGKHVAKCESLNFFHVYRIMKTKEKDAVVAAVAKTHNGRAFHRILLATWQADAYGVNSIKSYIVLKEDELHGFPTKHELVQADCKGLSAERRGDANLPLH